MTETEQECQELKQINACKTMKYSPSTSDCLRYLLLSALHHSPQYFVFHLSFMQLSYTSALTMSL